MTSLGKMLNVLNMFGPNQLVLDIDSIAEHLQLSRATVYRYLKELCDFGLINRVGGKYTLGPRVIELDWLMRRYDPVVANGQDIISELAETTGLTVYISVLYDGRIINTHIESNNKQEGFTFGRGRPLPLFKGAQSKVLVAAHKGRKLKRLFEQNIDNNPDYDLTWKAFSQIVRQVNKDGYCITQDELNVGLTGVAAPIVKPDSDEVLGSIALVGDTSAFDLLSHEAVAMRVKAAAEQISARTVEDG